VTLRATCIIHELSGWGVMPAMWTEREVQHLAPERVGFSGEPATLDVRETDAPTS
jgi:hypothetical protein